METPFIIFNSSNEGTDGQISKKDYLGSAGEFIKYVVRRKGDREMMDESSIVSRREGLVGGWGCNDEVLIDDAGKASTHKRPNPVDPVVGEVPGN